MESLFSYEFNMNTACVELRYLDGSMISIDCTAVENGVADNMNQRSELDWLIYNDPAAYADLILNGNPETYLKTVTEYKPLDRLPEITQAACAGMKNARIGGFSVCNRICLRKFSIISHTKIHTYL